MNVNDSLNATASYRPMPFTPNPIAPPTPTRRAFCRGAATLLLACNRLLRASAPVSPAPAQASSAPANALRPDVAAVDHDRILAAATRALTQPPTPLTSLPCPRSPGTPHDYYSEAKPDLAATEAKPPTQSPTAPFTAHRDALFALGLAVPALAAAYLLTGDERYSTHAALHLRAWFVDPATSMTPRLDYGDVAGDVTAGRVAAAGTAGRTAPSLNAAGPSLNSAAPSRAAGGTFEGILETLPLVEIAQAIPFLAASPALTQADRTALHAWFAAYLRWLTAPEDSGPRLPALARDRKDHHGTSWMLQVVAYSLLTAPEGTAPKSEDDSMVELRHRYKTVMLRAQVSAEGSFTHDLSSANPLRDSLSNLDMLAAICLLLSTRFESLWDFQLEDGPGMRAAIAYHLPFMADRGTWPFRADATHFEELPGRRASLLFTARPYQRPEYAALWLKLPPDAASADVLRSIPVHQPLLWVRQAPRGVAG
jgi:hypothetical protein